MFCFVFFTKPRIIHQDIKYFLTSLDYHQFEQLLKMTFNIWADRRKRPIRDIF